MSYFPMMVELDGADVLVVGGGKEGLRKVEILKDFGASITLISPEAEQAAVKLADVYECRNYTDGDITKNRYRLVVASTDDRELNRRIYEACIKYRIPVNVVDDTELCTFIFPAIIKDREVVCAVSSGGKSPYVALHVKSLVKDIWPEGIGDINDRMGEYRKQARENYTDRADRSSFLAEKLSGLLAPAGTGKNT